MQPLKLILEALFWMLAAAVLLAALAVVLGWLTAPALGFLAIVLALALLPLGLRMMALIRRRRAMAVLAYVDQAVRLNLPLPTMLEAAQRSEDPATAHRLEQLRRRLEDGYSLSAAVRAAVPEMDPRGAALLTAAERLGQLPHALDRLVRPWSVAAGAGAGFGAPLGGVDGAGSGDAGAAGSDFDGTGPGAFFRAYPFMMITVMTMSLSVLSLNVIPKFKSVMAGFDAAMPRSTAVLIQFAQAVGPFAIIVAIGAVIVWAGRTLWRIFYAAEASLPRAGALRERLLWALPVTHRLVRDRGLAEAFDLVAHALRRGVPADRAIVEAAHLRINAQLARRLTDWSSKLTHGQPLHEAARSAGMPALIVEMLAPVRDVAAGADVFTFLARYYATRFSRFAILLQSAAMPATVLFFGALVAWVAVAMFAPMLALIETLSGSAGKWKL